MFIATYVWNHSSGGFLSRSYRAQRQITTPVYKHLAPTEHRKVANPGLTRGTF